MASRQTLSRKLYGVNTNGGGIYEIDVGSGSGTLIGSGPFGGQAGGLAFDPVNNRLFVSLILSNRIYEYDLATGTSTLLVTATGTSKLEGLAYDAARGILYGLSDGEIESIVRIDLQTGAVTLVAPMTAGGLWRGLTFDPRAWVLYATRVNPSMLTRIDPETATVTNLGPIAGIGSAVQGCAWMETGSGCYVNCDNSTALPVLNVADFNCFLQNYAGQSAYANCDQSTSPPVLNVADFTCFLQCFAAGCP